MQKTINKTNIVFTGGHAGTTALAVVEAIKKTDLDWEIHWIGPLYAVEGKKEVTLEAKLFPQEKIVFHPLFSGRVQRKFTLWTIPSILKIPFGFFHALSLLIRIHPKAILSFGGFSAFPVVVVGWFLGIPVVLHEQTSAAGRANRFSSFFATKIALARESSRKYFSNNKSIVTGNPIFSSYFKIKPTQIHYGTPIIFITGGSRGSTSINSLIEGSLPYLLNKYQLIHLTGPFDYSKFENIKAKLPNSLKTNYEVYQSLLPSQMSTNMEKADLVISRAGANTVSELIAAKEPCILIPIPWSYLNEQTRNAEYAREFGIARIMNGGEVTPDGFIKEIDSMFAGLKTIQEKVKDKVSPDIAASEKLVNLIQGVIK
jgi:UDP-N-acetylglucosamine--N-acetylmuramyl-(pentapeptide) pyrophosphoryl-undecaprenol N-acetylglucosamine transferase